MKLILESHIINHANSMLTITPTDSDFGIETRHSNKKLEEMATTYARKIIQKNLKFRILFSASFN